MRAVLLFLVLFTIFAAIIFGYKMISRQDVKIAGKLTFAALLALAFSVVIYLGEVS
jgi:hypothetical protein